MRHIAAVVYVTPTQARSFPPIARAVLEHTGAYTTVKAHQATVYIVRKPRGLRAVNWRRVAWIAIVVWAIVGGNVFDQWVTRSCNPRVLATCID